VYIFNDGVMEFAQRCANRAGAEFVASAYRRDFLRDGWTEHHGDL
jgi:hypothetical protein